MTNLRASLSFTGLWLAAMIMAGCGDDASSPATGQTNPTGGTSAEGGSAGSGTSGQAGANPNGCTPGKLESCPCLGTSTTGVQTCQADGTFSACQGCPTGAGGSGGTGATGGAGGTSNVGGSESVGGSAGSSSEGGFGGTSAGAGGTSAGAGGTGGGGAGGAGGAGNGGMGGSTGSSASASSLAKALGKSAGCEACLLGMTGSNLNDSDCTKVLAGCDADKASPASPNSCADAIATLQEARASDPGATPNCWVETTLTVASNEVAQELLLCAARTEDSGGCATACGGSPEVFSPGFICQEAPPTGCYTPAIAQPMEKCGDPDASACVQAICADPECKPKWEACESDPMCNAAIDCFAQCTLQGADFAEAFATCQPVAGSSLGKAVPITSCREKQAACN